MNVLIKFRHGLGDAVQLTTVLAHLAAERPDWKVDVASLVGKHTAHAGLSRRQFRIGVDDWSRIPYDRVFDLAWNECDEAYSDSPSTKAEFCLRHIFDITPKIQTNRYRIQVRPAAVEAAKQYLQSVCDGNTSHDRYPAVIIHYQGNTSAPRKNLSHDAVRQLCVSILDLGLVPIILDWDNRSPIPNNRTIHCPSVNHSLWKRTGTGDAELICALIRQSSLAIAVDSGPQKIAAATDTPTAAIWIRNHPVHYFCVADNVTHYVPTQHEEDVRGNRVAALDFFNRLYKFQEYKSLPDDLIASVRALLRPKSQHLVHRSGFWVRANNALQDLVIVRDIYEQDSYEVANLPLPQEIVIDVGAHIGTFAARWHRRNPNSRMICVEACPDNLEALRANVGEYAEVVHAACTYESDQVLLNAVYPHCVSTGGSRVLHRAEANRVIDSQYRVSEHALPLVTLDELLRRYRFKHVDLLKLDCEGSEFSILENAECLDAIGAIVGEYHGRERFLQLVERRFSGWSLRILRDGDPGTFWLVRR